MGVGLVATGHPTVVGFVGSVYVRMLLPVGTVGETSITAFEFAFERLFA